MEAQGADPDAVARFLEESLDDDEDDDEPPLTIWYENAESFRVFVHCDWQRVPLSNMETAQVIYTGINASEIIGVCQLLGLPSERWPQILTHVRIMANAAMPLLNATEGA